MAAIKRVTIPITVLLREDSLKALTVNASSPSEALSARCTQYLEQTADGAVTLTVDQVQAIEILSSKPVRGGADVVVAVERKSGFRDGANVLSFTIDPTWMGPLEERAIEAGRTVQDLIADLAETAFANGWLFGLIPAYPPIYANNYEFFRELTGQTRPTGEDVENAVRELQKSSRKAKREEVMA